MYSNAGSSTEQGLWSINNNLITFEDQTDGITYTGSVSGSVLTETFNSNGLLTSQTDLNGNTTTFSYRSTLPEANGARKSRSPYFLNG